jgi:pyruvate dehydrogenase E1 component alpha subunit
LISEIIIPDLGATGSDVSLDEWLVKPGDFVRAGTPLFVVTTDKAKVEVEAFRDGYIQQILVPAGSTVALGTVVAVLASSLDEQAEVRQVENVSPLLPYQPPASRILASPLAQPVAREQDLDPATLSHVLLLAMFRRMVLIRRFEDYLYQLFLQGLVPGTLHQYQGQEAVAVGVCTALRQDDVIFSTHRPVGHLLAKGSSPQSIAAEIWGKATGCAGGKGGQMHLVDMAVGAFPSNAIVGANIPIATGAALGFKLAGLDRVAVSFFGDAASNIGAFHEGINLAAVKDAPVIFVCENNLYGASTHISLATRLTDLAERAKAYGIPGFVVDGMDVVAVYQATQEAVERARQGHGPTFLECKTYRFLGHSRGDPGGYRTRDEVEAWRQRDPLLLCRQRLVADYGLDEPSLEKIELEGQAEVEAAVQFAQSSPEPAPEACFQPVYAEREVN